MLIFGVPCVVRRGTLRFLMIFYIYLSKKTGMKTFVNSVHVNFCKFYAMRKLLKTDHSSFVNPKGRLESIKEMV